MKTAGLFLAVVSVILAVPAGRGQEAGPVDRLTAQFEEAKTRALVPVESETLRAQAAYVEQLKRLEKRYMEEGNLDALLEVQKEEKLFAKTSVTGGGELKDLEPLREIYQKSLEPIEEKRSELQDNLRKVYRTSLEEIQSAQTKAGNLAEAMKAKKILDGLVAKTDEVSNPEKNAMVVKSGAPWSAPAPSGEEVLNGGNFLNPLTLPVGRHRLRDKITIGAREPARPNQIYLLEGTSISTTDKGEIFVMTGEGNAFGVRFEGAYLTGGLGADWHFINCVLERTRLAKGDGWRGRPQASRWIFENTLVSGDLFESWNTQDVGYQATRTTFDRVKFPDLDYRQDAGTLAQTDTLVMRDCLFRSCDLPLSVLISTVNCAFEDCSFRDDAKAFSLKSPISVTVYASESSNRLRKVPDRVKVEIEPMEAIKGEVGAAPDLVSP